MSLAYTPLQMRQFAKRREQMRMLRSRGWTLQAIGEKFAVKRQRVAQILGTK